MSSKLVTLVTTLVTSCILNWTSQLEVPIYQNLYKCVGLQNSFFQFSFAEISKLVTQIVKFKLLEMHFVIGFTKFFIKPNFICRGDIRTYHDLLVEYIELMNTVHSSNIRTSCGPMLLFIVIAVVPTLIVP